MPKTLPLHHRHQSAGATFVQHAGWTVPEKFDSLTEEYQSLSRAAGLLDLSGSGMLELLGEDRTRFLHGMVTNDVKALRDGQGCYAAFLTPQGRMVADLRVLCLSESWLLAMEPGVVETLEPSLRKYIIGGRPLLLNRSGDLALLSIQGPKSFEVAKELLPSAAGLEQPFEHRQATLSGCKVRICRVNRTAAGGYDLIVAQPDLPAVWHIILDRGRPWGLRPVGFDSYNVKRIEAGIPWYGVDMDEHTLPIEAGLEKNAISFSKGCYIGQESVARITYRGQVNRKLTGLLLSGIHPASRTDKIFSEEQEVGWVTSSEFSLTLQKPIALGYLRREFLKPGTPVQIESKRGLVQAEVISLPFVSLTDNPETFQKNQTQ